MRAIALRAAFEQRDAVFEIGGVPGGNTFVCDGNAYKLQDPAAETGFSDGMLRDEPGGFGAVRTGKVLRGPTMERDEFPEPRGILEVNGFHTWLVGPAELVGLQQFFANREIFSAHGQQFTTQFFDHKNGVSQGAREK